jgi:triacylglycerol lipase
MRPPSIPAIPPLWRESRVALELASLLRDPIYKGVGVEDAGGQPVLLIPGFLAGDDTLGVMTQWLRRTGHRTRKAGIRTNIDCSEASIEKLQERLEVMAEARGQKIAVIGQSRGGTLAKVLAVRRPDLVSGVVALGAPITDPLGVHPVVRMQVYAVGTLGTLGLRGFFKHSCRNGECCKRFWADLDKPVPDGVGFLSIYSKKDGIVKWRACIDPSAVNHEIDASHIGMAVHPDSYRAIAGALAAFRTRTSDRARARVARRASSRRAA